MDLYYLRQKRGYNRYYLGKSFAWKYPMEILPPDNKNFKIRKFDKHMA